jgi:proteic killer suppression protein
MEVIFADAKLARIDTEQAAATKLPISVIMSCRRKLVFLRAAPDERTLRNWRSLHYEKLSGDREGQRSIRLNDQWRLIFKLIDNVSPPRIEILEIADYH